MELANNKYSLKDVIIVTGAAGFIGSCIVQHLNELGIDQLILVDDFGVEEKRKNWQGKRFEAVVERYNYFDWLERHDVSVNYVIHLGARTDTTEFNYAIHEELNVEYSKRVWTYCTDNKIPLIYASSAATYGNGQFGYNDSTSDLDCLHPLNPYGISKNEFDKWAVLQNNCPPFWAGLKFFNVYGPNEYHKKRMASVVFHAYQQIKKVGVVELFKSYKEGYKDGKQLRDFIYVKDVVKVISWMMNRSQLKGNLDFSNKTGITSGLYNVGTGEARSFEDLVKATFGALDLIPAIRYIDMPEDLQDTYQYFTQANMSKLRDAGYSAPFYTLEEGVNDYVRNYLSYGYIY